MQPTTGCNYALFTIWKSSVITPLEGVLPPDAHTYLSHLHVRLDIHLLLWSSAPPGAGYHQIHLARIIRRQCCFYTHLIQIPYTWIQGQMPTLTGTSMAHILPIPPHQTPRILPPGTSIGRGRVEIWGPVQKENTGDTSGMNRTDYCSFITPPLYRGSLDYQWRIT